MLSDKRWGGKRRPRITIPEAVTEYETKRLFKVYYQNTSDKKNYYTNVLADTAGEAEKIAINRYYNRTLQRIERTDENVSFQYQTYDVRYRGEHQDLLRAK